MDRYILCLESFPCANKETWEHRLMMYPENPLAAATVKMQIGNSIYRTMLIGDSKIAHAAMAFLLILEQEIANL